MKLEYINGLLHVAITLTYKKKTVAIDRVILDTGAAQSLIAADSVFDLGIFATPDDELTVMSGIGGDAFAFRKKIDRIAFSTLSVDNLPLDFGELDEGFGINGIIGLDILLRGKFVIDLDQMIIFQK